MADSDFYSALEGIECVRPAAAAAVPEMDADNVDRISGVKVWECALDLAKFLVGKFFAGDEKCGASFRRQVCRDGHFRVLELGCGHAVPAVSFAKAWRENSAALSAGDAAEGPPALLVTLQDYDASVLEHVTKRNVARNVGKDSAAVKVEYLSGDWASLTSSRARRDPKDSSEEVGQAAKRRRVQGDDVAAEGQGAATSHTSSGGASGASDAAPEQYDLILASECIYAEESFEQLAELLRTFLKLDGVAYFAAKRYYFGTGGGTTGFRKFLLDEGGQLREARLSVDTSEVIDDRRSNIREILEIRRVS